MFGAKHVKKNLPQSPNSDIVTIPSEFFGGADPTVHFKKTEKTVDLNKTTNVILPNEREKRELDAATAKGSFFIGTKVWVIGGIILFLLAVGGATLYYYFTLRGAAQKSAATNKPAVTTTHTTTTVQTTVTVTPTGEATPSTTATTTIEQPTSLQEPILELPSKLSVETADLDSDGVSDAAEEIFGSDPGNPDTDGDGYNDGHELYYLYNPNGIEPMKVIDAGTVRIFKSGNFNYELYYPINWLAAPVDNDGRQMIFTTLTGENVEVHAYDLAAGETFADLFVKIVPVDELLSAYTDVESRFGTKGKMRNDGLVYFFVGEGRVYTLVYHEVDENLVRYKKVMEVMARSFKINETTTGTMSLPAGFAEFSGISTTSATTSIESTAGAGEAQPFQNTTDTGAEL